MSSHPVRMTIEDGVATITINNPPVNIISQAVREGMMATLDAAAATDISRGVLIGTGKAFVAGSDLTEFNVPPEPPVLPDIVRRIDCVGLSEVLRQIETFAVEDPRSWAIPDLLRRAVQEGLIIDELQGNP